MAWVASVEIMFTVSIVIPCYNEQDTIRLLLEALYNQTFPRREMEVIIADGLSTDRTREEIRAFQKERSELQVRIVNNPDRSIPAGLNRAIAAAQGEYIVRLDAHSVPHRDYVERCIRALDQNKGENVGGMWEIHPRRDDWQARSIAVAASHPLGVGDARYRIGSQAKSVETVPFGAFRRDLVNRIGVFDETLLSNEDYEFNVRVRQAGGTVWLDPAIRSDYFARPTLKSLARQYWRYGFWKARMLQRYPGTFRWRQLAGFFTLTLIVFGVLGFWFSFARWLFILEFSVYTLALVLAGIQSALKHRSAMMLFGVPLAIIFMHFSWGIGFLWSLVRMIVTRIIG